MNTVTADITAAAGSSQVTPSIADMPNDKYRAEAEYFFFQWADKLRKHDATVLELAQVRNERDACLAQILEAKDTVRRLEDQLREGRDREARALEQIGTLKGILHAHGASIADVVAKIAGPLVPGSGAPIGRDQG